MGMPSGTFECLTMLPPIPTIIAATTGMANKIIWRWRYCSIVVPHPHHPCLLLANSHRVRIRSSLLLLLCESEVRPTHPLPSVQINSFCCIILEFSISRDALFGGQRGCWLLPLIHNGIVRIVRGNHPDKDKIMETKVKKGERGTIILSERR